MINILNSNDRKDIIEVLVKQNEKTCEAAKRSLEVNGVAFIRQLKDALDKEVKN